MVVAQTCRRVYPGARDEGSAQGLDDLPRRLVAMAVLAVQERQVDGRAAGERERLTVLLDARANSSGGIGCAGVPIPPAERSGRGLARKDVHHKHLARARQHVPA